MPKVDVDYSNTIIYKIVCKDTNVHYKYVSHTTNFTQRKYSHKVACNKPITNQCDVTLYKTVNEHGGWQNWEMIELARYACNNINDAQQKEKLHYAALVDPNDNNMRMLPNQNEMISRKMVPTKTKFLCTICSIYTQTEKLLIIHKMTYKHQKKMTASIF